MLSCSAKIAKKSNQSCRRAFTHGARGRLWRLPSKGVDDQGSLTVAAEAAARFEANEAAAAIRPKKHT